MMRFNASIINLKINTMVKVYYESNSHAELVATFTSEDTYISCLPALKANAKKHRMKVTEMVIEGGKIEDIKNHEED